MPPTYINAKEAADTLRRNLTPRQIDLERLEQFVAGTQYDGLPNWFSESSVPLWERAPCIRYTIVATAITSNVDLVLGESRFPAITSNPGENDEDAGGLDEEQSKNVDRALDELIERSRFHSAARSALTNAQGARSVAAIVGVRAGKPFVEHVRSRWCTDVQFALDGSVTSLEIRYPYTKAVKLPDGQWKLDVLLYRRVIDAVSDTTFLPLPAAQDGREPKSEAWQPDTARTVQHGLGFCPAHWYAHMKECTPVGEIDGVAIHETQLEGIRGLDFALSQRHRAALFAGDPQLVEIGVEPGYNPSGTGRTAAMPATLTGGKPSGANPVTGSYESTAGTKAARRKSPGDVFQYESKDTQVEWLTLPADALEAIDRHAADLRNKLAESMFVVILDPENVKITGAMSGRAIQMLRGRQYDRCDAIRDDFEANWILPVVQLLLRVALKAPANMRALAKARGALQAYLDDATQAPRLFVRWPSGYSTPEPAEELQVIQGALQAKDGGIATLRMAVQRVAGIFGVTNVDQTVEQIEAEREERADAEAERDVQLAHTMAAANGNDAKQKPGQAPANEAAE